MTTAVTLGIVLATAGPAAAASTAPPVPVRAGLLLVAAIAGALIVVGLVIGAARTHRDH